MISAEHPILASRAEASGEFLVIVTAVGEFRIRWEDCSHKLAKASHEQRERLSLSPSGYGIHWPLIDEDLSVKGLVGKSKAR
jgi:hypothetical protein